jgi:hypothetical protein
MTASVCADAFIHTWVARYGVPGIVTTDRGRQFTLPEAQHSRHLHNSLPSPKQWDGGEISPPVKGRLEGEAGGSQVD